MAQNPFPSPAPNQQPQDPLAQLQDIHLPDAIGFWPPAWGWWLLFVIVAISIASVIFFARRHAARNAYRVLALAELKAIHSQYSLEKNSEYLQALSILLRRVALSDLGTQFNASIKGEDWLLWLDAQNKATATAFSQGVGRALLIGPYQKHPEFDRNALHNLAKQWIEQHRNQWQKKPTKIVKNNREANQHV